MKYAIISLGGAIGMGLSTIGDGMGAYSADAFAGIGCCVMILGLLGAATPGIVRLWAAMKKD